MTDTLAEVSGDRMVLGLGAGWHRAEFDAFGLPFDHLAARFDNAVEIVTAMLRHGRASVNGPFTAVADTPVRDCPDRRPPPILVAAFSPRMLELAARHADLWNIALLGLPDERYRTAADLLDCACERIERDPASIERTVGLIIGPDHVARHDDLDPLPLDPDALADAFDAWAGRGITEVFCYPMPHTQASLDVIIEATTRFRAAR